MIEYSSKDAWKAAVFQNYPYAGFVNDGTRIYARISGKDVGVWSISGGYGIISSSSTQKQKTKLE